MAPRTRTVRLCKHCPAPVKSVFEGPLKPNYTEKKYVIDTADYRVTRAYDEEVVPQKETKKPFKMRKFKSLKSSSSSVSLGNTNPLLQQWSGMTFMTEYENFVIDVNYVRNKAKAERGRQLWNQFKKKLRVIQYTQKTTNAGPQWFQDLSPYQMELTDNLHLVLHGDIEEGHSVRTQEYLFKVGIAPELPAKIVAKTVQETGRNPITFLFKMHQRLVELEAQEYEKAFGEAKKQKKKISPYSINERILLTCVFHLHYPTLLEKLDKILPEPDKEPKVAWGKKPPKKKIVYPSVYLEPQPINEKPWYEERAEEELQKKVLAKLKRQKEKREKEEFEKKLIEQKKAAEQEKEEKEMKARASLQQRKRRESLAERFKNNKTLLTASVFAVDSALDESVEKCLLPSRERKSMYFKNRDPDTSSSHMSNKPNSYEEKTESDEDLSDKEIEDELAYRFDPRLWDEKLLAEGCTQTPIRGVGKGCLYSPYVLDPDAPEEGISEATYHTIRKAPYGKINDRWTQTNYTKEFKPLKRTMREFILKQRAVEKQMEKFCVTALHRRGIFGPPTDNICKTHCLKDLEEMAVNHEITIIKPPSIDMAELSSEEELKGRRRHKVPNDFSRKELTTVKRLKKAEEAFYVYGPGRRRMSGPPLPVIARLFPESEPLTEKECTEEEEVPKTPEDSECPSPPSPVVENVLMNKPIPVECTDPQCELIDESELPIDEFQLAKRRIAVLPPSRQLQCALEYLSDKGDPLAVLPNIELVPWLVRWFDRRRGVKKVLTEHDKAELMQKSFDFWTADYNRCTTVPMVELPGGTYTCFNKKWMMNELDKELYKHRRGVKHVLIDNARDLFPSMFCEYFQTPLNKSFRQLFYTYFPACERDCLVSKPWDPNEQHLEEKREESD